MKNPFLWFAAGALVASVVIFFYASNREAPKSEKVAPGIEDAENSPAKDSVGDTPAKVAAADPKKEYDASRGIASFYGIDTNGTVTASGVPLDDSASTAAHRTLPFGSFVRVTNLSNGLSEVVEITDRGPFIKGRIIDVSRKAAEKLDMINAGVVSVEIEVLPEAPDPTRPSLVEE